MGIHMMAEGAVVSHRPVPMCPRLVRCSQGMSEVGRGKSTTIGESTSGKSSDGRAWKSSTVGMVLGNGTEVRMGSTYEQGESSRGEER
jgi:hypothetical protein